MSCRGLLSNGTYTTGTWRQVEAYNVGWVWSSSTLNADDLNTERTISVTFANAGNQIGIGRPFTGWSYSADSDDEAVRGRSSARLTRLRSTTRPSPAEI